MASLAGMLKDSGYTVTGSDEKIAAAFEVTYSQMCRRIESLLALSDLNKTSLQAALAEIGDMD